MSVNSQITDAITEANVKVLGDAPAIAMGNLYQATAQALANAAHNATTAQQQSYITMQAATTMGVATLYSIDAAASAEATQQRVSDASRSIQAAIPPQSLATSDEIRMPIRRLAEGTSGVADDVAYAMRVTMNAVAASMDAVGAATANTLMHVLQIAATSACLTAMIAHPEKASDYEEVLAAIKRIV